ncbi:LacI family DNA-binding transcriptional regulator [Falsochrobactrum sp. TDYN1]|uniref:LacI family DNA-binding transcriptional regulator n=1 Tax=Falsochrobactrum tianjinense TaxID=2706015 RepID=A0A949PNF3_9HYPH|nr:LacI family DNA-binding transcriptional regulator [Falsochrobactrum sp. TDYN1]MBV2143545.1 LacI family DNA-binding transcriptional regulator [Falsochrobactrum sp. TDYN1]
MQTMTIPTVTQDPVARVPSSESERALRSKGQVRIEAVAEIAGVSAITVSRTLRKPELVTEKTRTKVTEAVRATGFSLNPHASALRSGRSNVVAVFVSSMASEQFLLAADAFSDVVEALGFEIVLARTSYSYEREIRLTRSLSQIRPAGAFITGMIEQELNRDLFRRLNIPIVESWAYCDTPIDMLVGVSNTDGVTAMVQYLAQRGYRRPAYIGRAYGRGLIRHVAFQKECGRLGLENGGSILLPTVRSQQDGRVALSELLRQGRAPDAVFCANDLLACGALLEAKDRGLRVPEDIAISGFGNSTLMQELSPGITTVTVDATELGRLAGEMLAARLTGTVPKNDRILMPLTLLQRGSC